MCMDIEGALRNKSFGGFTNDDGTPCSKKDVKKFLQEQLSLGRRVIPLGKCEGFDYQTGCPGHIAEPQEKE